tara:strand:+ start:18381 stop:18653 length:273 start_codon:yes stop_codon:yes gene_type:complete
MVDRNILFFNEFVPFLQNLYKELELNNELDYLKETNYVIKMRLGVSQTEFLGESRFYLERIINQKPNISSDTMGKVKHYKKLIDDAFRRW